MRWCWSSGWILCLVFCLSVWGEEGHGGFEAENTTVVGQSAEKIEEFSLEAPGSGDFQPSLEEEPLDEFQQVFVEVVSQNAGIANHITTSGPPTIVTLENAATVELKQRADASQKGSETTEDLKKVFNESLEVLPNTQEDNNSASLVKQEQNNSSSQNENKPNLEASLGKDNASNVEKPEEIPSFSEWAQKQLEEAEKKEQVNSSVQGEKPNGKQTGGKQRWKNYASLDCGAKVIAANPESVSPGAILSPSRDEYKLNACTSRIWFVVELCEAIQVQKIDLANYELFSSSPKDFTVSMSDRFPTRDWSAVGQFTAKDEKDIQSFELEPQLFGKYVKVEIKSHYGQEHYCPISLFRVFGTSVFEVLQKEDPGHVNPGDDDDDDDDDENGEHVNGDSPKNLFSSATDAVISMVKKAAEVLGNKANFTNQTNQIGLKMNEGVLRYSPLIHVCSTPSHLVVCDNCTEALFGEVYELLSCQGTRILHLIGVPFVKNTLKYSELCLGFGFDLKPKNLDVSFNTCPECLSAFFSDKYLGAMCNYVAVGENKVVLNGSQQYRNESKSMVLEEENILDGSVKLPEQPQALVPEAPPQELLAEHDKTQTTDPLTLDITEISSSKSTCSTDISYSSQIKPSKISEPDILSSNLHVEDAKITASIEVQQEKPEIPDEVKPIEEVNEIPESFPETESVETLDDHLDHFINELNEGTKVDSTTPTAATPQAQKESVFLRLSNRIKALERNMSLSSQYLEELSKRYKKQVEEMQKLLEKTVVSLSEEAKKKDEINRKLEERLESLTIAVENLLQERNSIWTIFALLFLFAAMVGSGFWFCYWRNAASGSEKKLLEVHRRNSIDVVNHLLPLKKKRRPSDQVLKIVRASIQSGVEAPSIAEKRLKDRKKKRKRLVLRRSNSINTLSEENDFSYSGSEPNYFPLKVPINQEADWIEGHAQSIENTPYVLEESEHSFLENFPIEDEVVRIQVPNFVQTAGTARLNRTTTKTPSRKSTSLDETARRWSPAPSLGNSSVCSMDSQTPKKERKGFKKLLKKVFYQSEATT